MLCVFHLGVAGNQSIAADSAYNQGVSLYKAKSYKAAADQFEKQLKVSPSDPNCLYYCALCQQLSNNRARARQLYEYVAKNFPNSPVAGNANIALGQLAVLSAGSSGSSSGASPLPARSSELAGVPDEVRIPFERKGLHAYVDVLFNNRSVSMIFDTGAEITAIGDNHLEDMGMAKPETNEKMIVSGVGDNTKIHAWVQKFDLKLGPIYRRDFPVTVQPNMPTPPLLGQTFFKDFDVTLDDASKQIIFRKKHSMAARDAQRARGGTKAVPFTRSRGGSLYVDALVNGKPYKMIFDTGAHSTVFTLGDFKSMGLSLPADAEEGQVNGIGGSSRAWHFNLRSLKVGPLAAENVPISVSDSPEAGHPLLGQTFFGNLKYAIDNEKNVIYFSEQ